MTIKPEIHSYIHLALLVCCIVGCDFLFIYIFQQNWLWWGTIAITVVSASICLPYGIVTCRTLCFESRGCTVSFLGFHKFTPWSQIVIRQEENFNNALTHPGAFAKKPDAGAVFSTKKKVRPWWLGPEEYCILRNPFTTFCVVYREENAKAKILSSHIVDREDFLATLASFGIELKKVKKKGWLG